MKKKLMLILMMSLIGMTAFAQNSTNYVDLGLSVSWATCNLGTGVWKKNYAPKYNGQSITEWCDICKGYDHKHYHETCTSCNGKGGYYR